MRKSRKRLIAVIGSVLAILATVLTIVDFFCPSLEAFISSAIKREYSVQGWWSLGVLLVLGLLALLGFASGLFYARCTGAHTNRNMTVYDARTMSDADMLTDMLTSQTAQFFGISNHRLWEYLRDFLKKQTHQKVALRDITVVYASNEDGDVWEGDRFARNLSESRQNIAAIVTEASLHRGGQCLEKVSFLQNSLPSTYGGCTLGPRKGPPRVLYIVNHLPALTPDARDSLTVRVQMGCGGDRCAEPMARTYVRTNKVIIDRAKYLGTFRMTLWDRSMPAWAEFVEQCAAYAQSMNWLVNWANILQSEHVLDIATGTGHTAVVLKEHLQKGNLTVLDASPQMIKRAKEVLGDSVNYALCSVSPDLDECFCDLQSRFDVIVIHLAMPAVADGFDGLLSLARWCKGRLSANGRIVLAAHNTAVESTTSTYKMGRDVLRETICSVAQQKGLQVRDKCQENRRVRSEEVESAFVNAGYDLRQRAEDSFAMTMEDRVRMWRAPVVLDTLVDVSRMNTSDIRGMLDVVHNRVGADSTPDLTVGYWLFVPRASRLFCNGDCCNEESDLP